MEYVIEIVTSTNGPAIARAVALQPMTDILVGDSIVVNGQVKLIRSRLHILNFGRPPDPIVDGILTKLLVADPSEVQRLGDSDPGGITEPPVWSIER